MEELFQKIKSQFLAEYLYGRINGCPGAEPNTDLIEGEDIIRIVMEIEGITISEEKAEEIADRFNDYTPDLDEMTILEIFQNEVTPDMAFCIMDKVFFEAGIKTERNAYLSDEDKTK